MSIKETCVIFYAVRSSLLPARKSRYRGLFVQWRVSPIRFGKKSIGEETTPDCTKIANTTRRCSIQTQGGMSNMSEDKKTGWVYGIFVFSILITFVACTINSPSPSQVVQKFHSYVDQKETSNAYELLSQRVRRPLAGMQALGLTAQGALESASNVVVADGRIKNIVITAEKIEGETAIVNFEVTYEYEKGKERWKYSDGTTSEKDRRLRFKNGLIKEDGKWKIDMFSPPIR